MKTSRRTVKAAGIRVFAIAPKAVRLLPGTAYLHTGQMLSPCKHWERRLEMAIVAYILTIFHDAAVTDTYFCALPGRIWKK